MNHLPRFRASAALLTLLFAAPAAAQNAATPPPVGGGYTTPLAAPEPSEDTSPPPPPPPPAPAVTAPAPAPAESTSSGASAGAPDEGDASTDPTHSRKGKPALSTTRGFAAAAQIGYAFPSGSISEADGDELARSFGGAFAMQGEIGVRVTPALFIGVYGGYAPGSAGSALTSTCSQIDCSTYEARGGVAVRYRFFAAPSIQPWVGYAAGYEVAGLSMSNGVQNVTATLTGVEYAHLSAGLDYSDDEFLAFGPVLDFGFGEYKHMVGDSPSQHVDHDIARPSMHQWVTLGLRLTLMP